MYLVFLLLFLPPFYFKSSTEMLILGSEKFYVISPVIRVHVCTSPKPFGLLCYIPTSSFSGVAATPAAVLSAQLFFFPVEFKYQFTTGIMKGAVFVQIAGVR